MPMRNGVKNSQARLSVAFSRVPILRETPIYLNSDFHYKLFLFTETSHFFLDVESYSGWFEGKPIDGLHMTSLTTVFDEPCMRAMIFWPRVVPSDNHQIIMAVDDAIIQL